MKYTILLPMTFLGIGAEVFYDADWITTSKAALIALSFASFSLLVSLIHIIRHLRNFSMPQIQVYVIRILLTCPVYAVTSSIALTLGTNGMYAEVVRDVYEAFVLYSFFNLILEFCGGETDCVHLMENEPMLRMPFPLCFMRPRARDTRLMRFCSRGVLQFIITKPIVAMIDLILLALGQFYNPIWQLVEAVVYNISYIWALYCLFVFYLATESVIKQFHPMGKFAAVKSIIFATYYQSLILKLLVADAEQGYMWNDLLLCIEMVIFSIALLCAFPIKEFEGGIPDRNVIQNMKDVIQMRDIYQDVYHNFNSTYRDYALQRSETEAPATSKLHVYFAGNLNRTALEMAERYRGRSKRMAFNSVLRGTRPIKAKLRREMPELWNTDSYNTMHSMRIDDRKDYGAYGSAGMMDESKESGTPSQQKTVPASPTTTRLFDRLTNRHGQYSRTETTHRIGVMLGEAFVMDTSNHSITEVDVVKNDIEMGNMENKVHLGRLNISKKNPPNAVTTRTSRSSTPVQFASSEVCSKSGTEITMAYNPVHVAMNSEQNMVTPMKRTTSGHHRLHDSLEAAIHAENEAHRAMEQQQYEQSRVTAVSNFSTEYRLEGNDEEAEPLTGCNHQPVVFDAEHDHRVWLEDLDCISPNVTGNHLNKSKHQKEERGTDQLSLAPPTTDDNTLCTIDEVNTPGSIEWGEFT